MDKVKNYIKENYREIIIITVITLLALVLRLILLSNYGDLWLDELYSWYFANQKTGFGTVWELLKQDLHMPVYFVILHFWMKVFGKSDISMHLCTLVLTVPLIPIAYYSMKYLFNKTAGYFAAILLAINTFGVYYSIEVRFYGLVFVLSLLSAVFFVKMLENFDKKYTAAFLATHLLLMYTFSITPLLTFCYGLVGLMHVILNKKEFLKKYFKVFGIIAAAALPAVIFIIYNMIVMHKYALCSFSKDIYVFSWRVIFDIFENFFANENYQLFTGNINSYRILTENLRNGIYSVFVGVPVLIGLIGLTKSFFSQNKNIKLFLYPSLLFLVLSLMLASTGLISFLTRYASIIYSILICSACVGLAQIKWKHLGIILLVVAININYAYIFVSKNNIFQNRKKELGNLTYFMENVIKPEDDDLILIPYSGSKVMKYVPKGKLIHFFADDALLLKDSESRTFYFDDKFYTLLNRENIKKELNEYVLSDKPFILYQIRLKDFYFDNMKKGQKFIIISYRDNFILPLVLNWDALLNSEFYENTNLFIFLMAKMTRDSIQVANMYLKSLGAYYDGEYGYSVYVFEKQ